MAQHTRWARLSYQGQVVFGAVQGDVLAVHTGNLFDEPVRTREEIALSDATWLTPCLPSKMIAMWNNYRGAARVNGWTEPAEPLYFAKTPNSFNAHMGPIPTPRGYDGRVIYEGELGIVIGRICADVSPLDAADHIFGYTCVNDVTAVELIGRDASFPQWTRAKSFDGFGVFGPVIATGLDSRMLNVRTIVNGRERQNYPAADMIFDPGALVSLISRDMTLLPGDVIACGTSTGALPMRPATRVEVAIEGIGVLANVYG